MTIASTDLLEARRAAGVIASSIRAHDEDEAEDRQGFLATAARGRPSVSGDFGRGVVVREGSTRYACRVFRTGSSSYRIHVAGGPSVEALVHPAGESIDLTLPAGTFSVVHAEQDRFTVDGFEVHVPRDDRGVVRAPVPSVVVGIPVSPGTTVSEGDRLVVLEAMKMEMSVAAPTDGVVRSVYARPNQQVDEGDPLLQLVRPDPPEGLPPDAGPVRFDLLVEIDRVDSKGAYEECRRTLEELRRLALGFDVDPALATGLGSRWSAVCDESPEGVAAVRQGEDGVLAIVGSVCSLSERAVVDDEDAEDGESMRAREEELLTYLRTLDAGHPALSGSFVEDLQIALSHQGVGSLERSPELEEAMFRIFRSYRRMPIQIPAVLAILDRRLERVLELRVEAGPEFRSLLDRLVAGARGRYPALSDLAREVRYRVFDQPLLDEIRRRAYAEAQATLDYLEETPNPPDRAARIEWLVACPQPLKAMLTRRMHAAPPEAVPAILEALARRYYRIRDLRDVTAGVSGGRPTFVAHYPHEGRTLRLAATWGTLEGLADAISALGPAIRETPPEQDIVVDLYLWREDVSADPDRTSEEIAVALNAAPFHRAMRRVTVALSGPDVELDMAAMEHFTFRHGAQGYREEKLYRGLHPMMGKRLDLWRLSNFWIDRLPSVEDVYLFRGVALENPKDERLFALVEVRDLTPVRDEHGRLSGLPGLELMITEALEAIRLFQSHRPAGRRLHWNRVLLNVWPPLDLPVLDLFGVVHRLAPLAEGLGLEKVVVRARVRDEATNEYRDRVLHISNPIGRGLSLRFDEPADRPIRPLSAYMQKVVQTRQKGLLYPYELITMLTPPPGAPSDFPPGEFLELDLDEGGGLVPVDREYGQNSANVVVGVISNVTPAYPEGMRRVAVFGDPSHALGSLAEPECSRICAALDLAERMKVPLEWFAVSAGAKISMSSGTENMDWIGRVLRRLIEFTQAGGEVNVLVCGINVGAQPYWNAEATMLMHTKGILVMTPESALVLTGKQALDYSGGVSAEDNLGIGGYDRVMGPNGQAQYWARDVGEACLILLRHYEHTYVAPGERFPRSVLTSDPTDRDVRSAPHRSEEGFRTVGEIFSERTNPGRKKPFDMRSLMRAVVDADHAPLERWRGMRDAETAVVWDAHLGGIPVCVLGIESRPVPRYEVAPADGPSFWTSGTLFPMSSKKIARAVNAASGNRPFVCLANLSGFDGSPESLRKLQLEYGAEIGRAVTNFRGPIVFCVVSRYHGGAFVVFSKTLNDGMEIAAVEGSFASVIGGAPAAAVVFAREVDERTKADPRIQELEAAVTEALASDKARARARLEDARSSVRSQKLGEVAAEFDNVHTIYRALEMGSVDRIIAARDLRPYLIDAVERGMRREIERVSAPANQAGTVSLPARQ